MAIHKEPKPQGEAWQPYRAAEKRTGGSDAGVILGLNPHKSPLSLWMEKTGKVIPEDISDKEAVRLGNDLEDYVARRFMEATGKKVQNSNFIWSNDKYPWAHANFDRVVVGEKAILECKTTDSWEIYKECLDGNYPESWYCQMTHYMAIGEMERAYLGVLCFGKGFHWFCLERNQDEIDALMDAEKEFAELVSSNTPPAADGSEASIEALKTIYADRNDEVVDLTPFASDLEMYESLKRQIKDMENAVSEIQANIMQYMGNAGNGKYDRFSVSWKNQSRKTFDKKAFEAAHGPIPEEFYKESVSSVFKVTAKKAK